MYSGCIQLVRKPFFAAMTIATQGLKQPGAYCALHDLSWDHLSVFVNEYTLHCYIIYVCDFPIPMTQPGLVWSL